MKISDLQFENGKLVKISGVRHQYMGGYQMIQRINELADMASALQHQLSEVLGTWQEYSDIPCGSLLNRHNQAMVRAAAKLEEMK